MNLPKLPTRDSFYILKAKVEAKGRLNDVEYLLLDGTLIKAFWHALYESTIEKDLESGDFTYEGIGYVHRRTT